MARSFTNIHEKLAEFRREREANGVTQKNNRVAFNHALKTEVSTMVTTLAENREATASAQRDELGLYKQNLTNEVQQLLHSLTMSRRVSADATQTELKVFRQGLQQEVQALREAHKALEQTYKADSAVRKQEVSAMLEQFRLERSQLGMASGAETMATSGYLSSDMTEIDKRLVEIDKAVDLELEHVGTTINLQPQLTDIHGIGQKTEQLLHAAGITSCNDLANVNAVELHMAMGDAVPLNKIQDWITAAKILL